MPNLEGDDLVWLIDYLDKVRRRVALLALRLRQPRFSMASILSAPLPGNAYVSSYVRAVQGGCSQRHTPFHLTFSILVLSRSPSEALVMCMWVPSMV